MGPTQLIAALSYQPCDWTLFSLSGLGGRFPRIPFIFPGRHYNWRRYQDFKALGSDVFVAVGLAECLFTQRHPSFHTY